MSGASVIRTSEAGWLSKLAKAYKDEKPINLMDDAAVGIDPETDSLLKMGQRAELRPRDWVAVFVSLGVGWTGIWMLRLAVIDPEPTSKLALLVGGGAVCVLLGGGMAIWILSDRRPPKVRATASGFELSW